MKFNIITLIPELYETYFNFSVFYNALKNRLFSYEIKNLRDFGLGIHKKVDDYPYGGGIGMILRIEPLVNCLNSFLEKGKVIFLSPRGKTLNQNLAKDLSQEPILTIVNGRYEGVDERFIEKYVDTCISIGDFILTGGDPAALALIDSVLRHIPGFLEEDALKEESFEDQLLEYPHYTRPYEYEGMKVPDILISGNHKEIEKWRKQKRIDMTKKYRPDLLKDK
ncbi:MAG: tRNA (guanosine(37)-N1)-methyltransferase TrmD [Spirochaetales bacterium]|nr:tRNA (guanosine(37)-N1)-methyltransferase TrmD [Spirochaetales bacterium]